MQSLFDMFDIPTRINVDFPQWNFRVLRSPTSVPVKRKSHRSKTPYETDIMFPLKKIPKSLRACAIRVRQDHVCLCTCAFHVYPPIHQNIDT